MRLDRAACPVAAVCMLAAALLTLAHAALAQQTQPPSKPPNIVFVLSDDEDVGIHASMPKVKALIEDQGAVFENFFTTYPLCCPARASILRGQYPHNTLVLGNLPPEGGFLTFRRLGLEESTIATWLHAAGYRTAFYGKYLNGYTETDAPPPGWDEWHAANNDGYFNVNYKLNENGNVVAYGGAPEDYLTDVLAAKAVATSAGSRPRAGRSSFTWRRSRRTARTIRRRATRACSRARRCRSRRPSTRTTSATSPASSRSWRA